MSVARRLRPILIVLLTTGWCLAQGAPVDAQVRPQVQAALKAPAAGYVQILRTTDGSTYIGRIVEVTSATVRFQTDVGELNIPLERIEEIEDVPEDRIRDGKYWFPNPNATRHYFGPTALMLPKGSGYLADYWVFFPSVAYGVSDNFTFSAGMSILPGAGFDEQIYMLMPKFGGPLTDKIHIAAGALMIGHKEVDKTFGIAYGVATYGSIEHNLTVGLGYGFVGSEVASKPIVMLGGQTRISRRLAFVTENWIVPGAESHPLYSWGFRFLGESLSVDLGFLNVAGTDLSFPGIPLLDFVFSF
jgi:hypothetical protein